MALEILAPISVGELFDKISILEIKLERLESAEKVANVRHELNLLRRIVAESGITLTNELNAAIAKLKSVNTAIWEAEDHIRDFERLGAFGDAFLKVARSIYRLNDARASAKREVNLLTSSSVVEEKSYAPYETEGGL
jgi:hypothetical protein